MGQMRFTYCHQTEQARNAESSNLGRYWPIVIGRSGERYAAAFDWVASPFEREREGEGRDLLRQMTRVALEPLTLVLSPSPRGEATECVSGIKFEMDLIT